jgi:hypothetical protein
MRHVLKPNIETTYIKVVEVKIMQKSVRIKGEEIPRNELFQLWKQESERLKPIYLRNYKTTKVNPYLEKMRPMNAFFVKEAEFERILEEVAGNLSYDEETCEIWGLNPEYQEFKTFGLSLMFSIVDKEKTVKTFDVCTQGIICEHQDESLIIALTYPERTEENMRIPSFLEKTIRKALLDCLSQYMCGGLSPDFMDVCPFRDSYGIFFQISYEDFKRLEEEKRTEEVTKIE